MLLSFFWLLSDAALSTVLYVSRLAEKITEHETVTVTSVHVQKDL